MIRLKGTGMNKKSLLLIALLFGSGIVDAQPTLIPTFKSPLNQYDYLIVSPIKFFAGAQKLAQFRQSFSGYKAGVVLLDTLYADFDSTGRKPYEKIWYGLKYAYKSWSVPPRIIVLMGTDSISYNFSDSTWHGYGDMPAVVYQCEFFPSDSAIQPQPIFDYSDDYYASLNDSIPLDFENGVQDSGLAVSVGRIPCDSAAQCERYVQKVIDFETNKKLHKSWFNSALVVSDDTMQNALPDPLGYQHLIIAEECANTQLRSYFVDKVVGCAFAPNNLFFKPIAEDSVVSGINQGKIWSIYIGHASSTLWSDERMLSGEDVARLRNDSTPSVFVSFSCTNGNFIYSGSGSMCKNFLFSPHGGAIAYIAATTETFATDNDDLMQAFFTTFNENRQIPLGQALLTAKSIVLSENSVPYSFLGDPALTLSNGRINLSMTRNDQNQISIACQSSGTGATSGNFDVRFYKRDTINLGGASYFLDSLVYRQSGTFSSGISIPALSNNNVRVVAYVWNENGEGRIDSSFKVSALPVLSDARHTLTAPSLKIGNGKLIFLAGALYGTTMQLTAFSLDGKTLINKAVAIGAPEITVDPKKMGLAAGTYFFRLSTVKGIFIQRMMLPK